VANTKSNKTVLVLYSDPHRRTLIESMNGALPLCFFRVDPQAPVRDQLEALETLARHGQNHIGGVVGINDFAGALAAAAGDHLGFTTPSPCATYQAQHKALFMQHAAACNPHYPPTRIIRSEEDIPIASTWYPAFIKPAASSLSACSFLAKDPHTLKERYRAVRDLKRADVTWRQALYRPLIKADDPPLSAFLLQPFLQFPQYTLDGYVHHGQVALVGITASIFDRPGHSFERFDFPAHLEEDTQAELRKVAEDLVASLGFDNGSFNVEFFVTEAGHIIVIEFNIRIAFQFVALFTARYAENYLTEVCKLALGETPSLTALPAPQSASSCVLRVYEDKTVIGTPSEEEIAALARHGLVHSVRLLAEPGKRLCEYKQDTYSFRYALFNILYQDKAERDEKIKRIKDHLHFVFK